MGEISRKNFKRASELIRKHPSFFEDVKEKALNDLLDRCETDDKYQLIDELIGQFYLMEHDIYGLILTDLAKHIVGRGFPANETALLALAHDSRPDSSETVIRDLYIPLFNENYPDLHQLETRNKFGKLHELYRAGRQHFFVVDEFLGSGKTAKIAYKDFLNETKGNATLEFIYVAGMKEGFENLKSVGASFYCPWIMEKAISGHYSTDEVQNKKDIMLSIETTLAPEINQVKLSDNSMGYGDAQAVYCMRNSNIPNSTFPVFWWYKDVWGKDISTIFLECKMVSKKLAIELVKALYQSTNGLLPYTLYSRFKMNAVDILAFVKQYQPKELIAVDEELRIKLTEEGRRYAFGLINQHKGEPMEGGSEYYKKILRPQLDKYDPYIPDKVFAKKYKKGKGG